MPIFEKLQNWISEPAPDFVFELTENSLAAASPSDPAKQRQEVLAERAAHASPATVNIQAPQLYRDALRRIATPGDNPRRRAAAALVIPDYSTRITVVDLEDFPASEDDRMALLRFRLRKSVPFPIDEARLSYAIQKNEPRAVEVLAAVVARPILEEYERLLSDAGFRVGTVLPSSLAALRLCHSGEIGLTVLAKIAGSVLSVLLLDGKQVKLARCVDLADQSGRIDEGEERMVIPLLQQTLAFAEDNLGQPVSRLLLCGFGPDTEAVGGKVQAALGVPYGALRSRFGTASQVNAGLLGLLERYAA